MDELAYSLALALALVMGIAGGTKLRRRQRTGRTFLSQGLAWPRALATAVPVTELVLAAGLVVAPGWAGVATLAVLAGFTTFLVRALRRGDPLGCGCFGAARPEPVGGVEVARNAVLLAVSASVAVVAPDPVVPGVIPLVVVVAGAGATAVALAAARRRVVTSAGAVGQGPPSGSPAPALPGGGLDPRTTTLVAFVAPNCSGCDELRASLERLERTEVAVVTVDLDDDASSAVFRSYNVRSAPFLVVVDGGGRVRSSGRARSPADVEQLLDQL
ncbi:MAG: thioredoxin family protein [Actinobacteria bacterium]|nr:thioredoxin family protein [Actinomycetota bacterium]